MVLSSWRGRCDSWPGSFDECKLSRWWPPTLRPSQSTWPVSPPVGCYHPHQPSPFISINQPKADTHFTVPRSVEGWVDLDTAIRVRSPCPRLYIAVAVVINITGRGLSHRSHAFYHYTNAICRDKRVWTTCLRLLLDSAAAGNRTRNDRVASPTP